MKNFPPGALKKTGDLMIARFMYFKSANFPQPVLNHHRRLHTAFADEFGGVIEKATWQSGGVQRNSVLLAGECIEPRQGVRPV
jgi:hypothetical protein